MVLIWHQLTPMWTLTALDSGGSSAATSKSSKRTSVDFGGAVDHRVVQGQGDGGGTHPHPVAVLEADSRVRSPPPWQNRIEILQMATRGHSLHLTRDT
ncbi:hypothetical protein BHM03_00053488 [Ensete ventricosum]|nr:hypothetical protein BHM03_00053488 [Ensete ventricosum]